MFRFLIAALAACACFTAVPAGAQFGAESSASKADFRLPEGPVKILVFRPDISVGEQSTGGMNEPNADWTADARKYLGTSLATAMSKKSVDTVIMPELTGEQGALLADYRALFRAVVNAVVTHKLFAGNRLPTKKADFRWTLGDGAAQLGRIAGGDYGLFLFTNDSYGSAGRKVAQVFGAMFGVGITSGVHIGYCGLVDLKTGDLVWVNADLQMGGNVRDAEGAEKRVGQLLEDFPTRASEMPVAPATAATK